MNNQEKNLYLLKRERKRLLDLILSKKIKNEIKKLAEEKIKELNLEIKELEIKTAKKRQESNNDTWGYKNLLLRLMNDVIEFFFVFHIYNSKEIQLALQKNKDKTDQEICPEKKEQCYNCKNKDCFYKYVIFFKNNPLNKNTRQTYEQHLEWIMDKEEIIPKNDEAYLPFNYCMNCLDITPQMAKKMILSMTKMDTKEIIHKLEIFRTKNEQRSINLS